jgi:transcriptional regulator with PAS, ATPase and Fis domain
MHSPVGASLLAMRPAPTLNILDKITMNTTESLKDYQRVRLLAIRSLFEIIEQSSEGTVIVDRDANIVWMNERYARRFGLESAEGAIGKSCESVIPGSLLREVVRTGRPILLDMQDTSKEPLVVMRLPIHDDEGVVIGAIGFALFDELRSLSPMLKRYMSMQEELASTRSLLRARQTKYNFAHFIGTSAASLEVKRRARRSASAESPVLLLGETGTGKELLAQAIHSASPRAHKAFVSINSAAIPESLLEAEFFGTAPGAFTGADRKGRAGKLQIAQGGTLFLDEIGDMPLPLQSKLLRVLQEKEFEPVGSNEVIQSDVRVIAATSTDLAAAIKRGEFRADLYYRLNVLPIHVPPLRDRLDDLPALSEAILEELRSQHELNPEALELLGQHAWPGNIRELRNVLERAALLSDDLVLDAAELRAAIGTFTAVERAAPLAIEPIAHETFSAARERFDRQLIESSLAQCGGKVVEAAARLGLGRSTLYKKMAALGIVESP